MSGQKSANPCNKFQANIFYKSKCQNCFKSRELHLPTDHGKDQVSEQTYLCFISFNTLAITLLNVDDRDDRWACTQCYIRQRHSFILCQVSLSFVKLNEHNAIA